jgi:DNA-directed RNA polymerase subunit RPC12/RpoP
MNILALMELKQKEIKMKNNNKEKSNKIKCTIVLYKELIKEGINLDNPNSFDYKANLIVNGEGGEMVLDNVFIIDKMAMILDNDGKNVAIINLSQNKNIKVQKIKPIKFKEIKDKESYLRKNRVDLEMPKLTDKKLCIHCGKTFVVGDYKVEIKDRKEYIVCPNAPSCDGKIIDWVHRSFYTKPTEKKSAKKLTKKPTKKVVKKVIKKPTKKIANKVTIKNNK